MDENYIPRRLLRFYRKKPIESEVKEKSAKIAVREVDNFVNENKRYPNREEMDKIADSVFEQLKKEFSENEDKKFENDIDLDFLGKEKRQARRQKPQRRREKEEKEEPKVPETAAIILPEENEELEEKDNIENIAELDEVASLEDELSEDDDFDNIDKEMEEKQGVCPRCKSKTEEIIFCPQCGEAFCNHCAKAIETLPEAIKYTCPNCGATFKKRKMNK